jgi:protein arginine kinase activator
MKCQRCTKAATKHITEVAAPEQVEEMHLCEDCAQKFLYEPSKNDAKIESGGEDLEETAAGTASCSVCGLKFVEFRNSGRLGCPHDYSEFRDELMPLLENIHGETRHAGKTPRRLPETRKTHGELLQLRKQLLQAVTREAYEEAASLRDRIRQLETS